MGEWIALWIHRPRVPSSRPGGYGTLSTELLTDHLHNSSGALTGEHVWKVREGFPDRVKPKTFKWVVVYSSVTFHING